MTTTTSTKQTAREAEAILKGERLLPVEAVAARYSKHPKTVLRWIKGGHLKAGRDPGGNYLVKLGDLVEFEAARWPKG